MAASVILTYLGMQAASTMAMMMTTLGRRNRLRMMMVGTWTLTRWQRLLLRAPTQARRERGKQVARCVLLLSTVSNFQTHDSCC